MNQFVWGGAAVVTTLVFSSKIMAIEPIPETLSPKIIVSTQAEPVAPGRLSRRGNRSSNTRRPTGSATPSSASGRTGGRNASPSTATGMPAACISEGSGQYKFHVAEYGHPSKFGFKDVIHEWKAEKWDPDKLVALYKRAGAQYFFAMANHHDNFDLWDSQVSAVELRRASARRKTSSAAGRRRPARRACASASASTPRTPGPGTKSPKARTKTARSRACPTTASSPRPTARAQWWDGLDPQDLYAQNHAPARILQWPTGFTALELGQRRQPARPGLLREVLQPHGRPHQQLPARPASTSTTPRCRSGR